MKINPNELNQNKYRTTKSSDLKKNDYNGNTFAQDLKNKSVNPSKLRICKSSEKLENVEVVEKVQTKVKLSVLAELLKDKLN